MSEKDNIISRFATLGLTQTEFDKKFGTYVKVGKWCNVSDVVKSKLKLPGVYMIRTPSHDLCLVGRTMRGIAGRMKEHISHPGDSNLNVMLCDPRFPQYDDNPEFLKKDVKYYEVYFTEVADKEEQKNVESHMVKLARLCGAEMLLNK